MTRIHSSQQDESGKVHAKEHALQIRTEFQQAFVINHAEAGIGSMRRVQNQTKNAVLTPVPCAIRKDWFDNSFTACDTSCVRREEDLSMPFPLHAKEAWFLSAAESQTRSTSKMTESSDVSTAILSCSRVLTMTVPCRELPIGLHAYACTLPVLLKA